jgi:hypothetical protein
MVDPLNELSGYSTVLIISGAKDNTDNSVKIIKRLLQKHDSGIFITVDQPYVAIKKILDRGGVDTDRLHFVDCISQAATKRSMRGDGVLYISSPSAVTEVGIAVTDALAASTGEKKFIFIDSLGTFLIYNSTGSISKFSHFLITKMQIMGVDGIFMSVEKEMDDTLITELQSFCEKTITLK